jgi:hypothetical protein
MRNFLRIGGDNVRHHYHNACKLLILGGVLGAVGMGIGLGSSRVSLRKAKRGAANLTRRVMRIAGEGLIGIGERWASDMR